MKNIETLSLKFYNLVTSLKCYANSHIRAHIAENIITNKLSHAKVKFVHKLSELCDEWKKKSFEKAHLKFAFTMYLCKKIFAGFYYARYMLRSDKGVLNLHSVPAVLLDHINLAI